MRKLRPASERQRHDLGQEKARRRRHAIWSRCAFGKGSMRDQNNTFRSGNEGVFEGEEVARSSGRCEKEARCDRDRARAWHRGLPDGEMSAFDASEAVRLSLWWRVMAKQNFFIYYAIDEDTIGTVLCADEYNVHNGSDEYSWVLLEKVHDPVTSVGDACAGGAEEA